MNNIKKLDMLNFLAKHTPKAPIGECMSRANEIEQLDKEEYFLRCQLAVLSMVICEESGKIKDEFMEGARPALKKALEMVSNSHAWVVCGPGPENTWERFLEEREKEIKQGDKT